MSKQLLLSQRTNLYPKYEIVSQCQRTNRVFYHILIAFLVSSARMHNVQNELIICYITYNYI